MSDAAEKETDKDDLPEISEVELRMRVVYSLLAPAAKLARRTSIPLKELTSLLEMACFHQLRKVSMTLREAADKLGVSRRKVADLSKQLKQNFFRPEHAHGLPRRIEYMLWAGPMTEGRIRQSISEYDDAAVEEALETLVEQDRVVVDEDGYATEYAVPDSEFRLYSNNWMARIDGLNNLMTNLYDAVVGRFFESDDRSFARTLNFRMREQDLDELRELYEEEIFETLAELEERVEETDENQEVIDMSLSTLWAPDKSRDSSSE